MLSKKDIQSLEANKADRVKVQKGLPARHEGRNGDLSVRQVPSGLGLYGKFHDKWYRVSKLEDITVDGQTPIGRGDDMEYHEVTVTKDIKIKKGSKGVILKNDAGTLKVRNNIDTADAAMHASTGTFMTSIELGHATDTTIVRASSGEINIEGNRIYRAGGTKVTAVDGGTGIDTSSSTGVLIVDSGTVSVETSLGAAKGGVTVTGSDENAVLTLGNATNNFVAEGGMKFFDSGGYNHLEFTSSSTDDAVIITSAVTAHNVAGDDVTLRAGDTTAGGGTDNIAGGHLLIQGGKGKGTGLGGSIHFTVYPAGSTGSTLNTPVTPLIINGQYGTVSFDKAAGFDRISAVDATNVTVDFRDGNKAHLDMTSGSISGTLTLQFPEVSGNFLLVVEQDTSARTIAAFATKDAAGNAGDNDSGTSGAVRWAGGSAPTLTDGSVTNNARDILSFYWDADGEVCYGTATHKF